MSKTWFKVNFTNDEFLDIVTMSNKPHGIRDAALKYNCSKQIIRSRIKSSNTFKGLPTQNKLKYSYDDNCFSYKKDKHYFVLGLLASDGCVTGGRLSLSQSGDKGKRLLYFVKGVMESNHAITHSGNAYCINLKPEKHFYLLLNNCNIFERKTYNYTLPNFETTNHFHSFLQGYIEGDGCIGVYNNGKGVDSLHISLVGTKNFIYSVNEKLPIKGTIRNIKNELYGLTFWGINAFKLFLLIYKNPIYIRGKYNIALNSYRLYRTQLMLNKLYSRILKLLKNSVYTPKQLSNKFGLRLELIYNLKWKRKKLSQKNLSNITKNKDL